MKPTLILYGSNRPLSSQHQQITLRDENNGSYYLRPQIVQIPDDHDLSDALALAKPFDYETVLGAVWL